MYPFELVFMYLGVVQLLGHMGRVCLVLEETAMGRLGGSVG